MKRNIKLLHILILLVLFLAFDQSYAVAGNEYCPEEEIIEEIKKLGNINNRDKLIKEVILRITRCESSTWDRISPLIDELCGIPTKELIKAYELAGDKNLYIIRFFGKYKSGDAVPFLIKILEEDPNVYNRSSAVSSLYSYGPNAHEAVDALIKAIDDQTQSGLSAGAVVTLGAIGPEAKKAVPRLIKVLEQGVWYMKFRAAHTLEMIGPEAKEAIPALKSLLNHDYKLVRKNAAEALEIIDTN